MVYQGSKNRVAKDLLPIITKHLTGNRWYIEPFCGGCNMIDKIKHPFKVASDSNYYLIELLKAVQRGEYMPGTISKDQYDYCRNNKEMLEPWYVGYVGFVCSHRGQFFRGWIDKLVKQKDGNTRNRFLEQRKNLLNQAENLNNILFFCLPYDELCIPSQSVIYCDPPYKGTEGYNGQEFNGDAFWQWCRECTDLGHDVLISEYTAPDDFVCVWEKQINSQLSGQKAKKVTEKLFVHKSIASKYK